MKNLFLGGAAALALALPAFAAAPQIDPAKLAEHIKILSSDAFEGRGPATAGETKTVAYLSKAFAEAGLQPGGDKLKSGKRAWTQAVPLAQFDIRGPVATTVKAGGQTLTWKQGEEVAIRAAQTGADHVAIKDAPIVFVGYGVQAPE